MINIARKLGLCSLTAAASLPSSGTEVRALGALLR